jgi:hypothetical protein
MKQNRKESWQTVPVLPPNMPCLLQVEKTVPGGSNPPGIFASAQQIRRESAPETIQERSRKGTDAVLTRKPIAFFFIFLFFFNSPEIR